MPGRFLFLDDYSEGAHPAILEAIAAANGGQEPGYGEDSHTLLAVERITAELGGRAAGVHLVSGGTQANLVALASMLRHHEGVVAASTAHIHVHEAGAVEATGHKLMTVASADGKLTPALVDEALAQHQDEHTVKPRVLFLSQATEWGTAYTLDELRALCDHAHGHGLHTFVDGARLAMALSAASPALRLADVAAAGVDMLSIGGTKNGALFGEAIAVLREDLDADFRYHVKQRGALLAKGRALGAQFARFFAADGLWYALGALATERARDLAAGLRDAGVELAGRPDVNQVFAVLPNPAVAALREHVGFHVWRTLDGERSVIRLVCSWATPAAEVERLVARVRDLVGR